MGKKLYLVTETFPYGTAEKTFILPELAELCKSYDVTIISHASKEVLEDKTNETRLNKNIKVVNIDITLSIYKKALYLLKFFCDRDGIQELKYILQEKENRIARIYQSIGFYALAMENFKIMEKKHLLHDSSEMIYYSYWYFYYTYSMTRHKEEFPKMRIVTRTHRFELYADQYKGFRQPFKKIMDANLDKVFFISDQGKTYYERKYKVKNENKYIVSRLGALGSERKNRACEEDKEVFRIVSCSRVIPLKRVNMITDALSILTEKKKIEWTHFGSGSQYDDVVAYTKKILQNNNKINFQFMGNVPNQKVLDFYDQNYINCFISTSSSEGIPVSIMEALSYGIPFIATNVGGVSELYEKNGILLKADSTVQEVAEAISEMIHMKKEEYSQLRENAYLTWENKYDAVENAKKFVQMLEA